MNELEAIIAEMRLFEGDAIEGSRLDRLAKSWADKLAAYRATQVWEVATSCTFSHPKDWPCLICNPNPSSPAGDWRPISEAPKDRPILGIGVDGIVRLVSWHYHKDFQCWAYMGLGGWFKLYEPTFWHPLPQPPGQEKA